MRCLSNAATSRDVGVSSSSSLASCFCCSFSLVAWQRRVNHTNGEHLRRGIRTLLGDVHDESSDKFDDAIRVGDTFLDGENTIDHVKETIIESFLASESDPSGRDLFPHICTGHVNLCELNNIFFVGRERVLALHEYGCNSLCQCFEARCHGHDYPPRSLLGEWLTVASAVAYKWRVILRGSCRTSTCVRNQINHNRSFASPILANGSSSTPWIAFFPSVSSSDSRALTVISLVLLACHLPLHFLIRALRNPSVLPPIAESTPRGPRRSSVSKGTMGINAGLAPKTQRTSKVSQKLVVLPSEPQTRPLPDETAPPTHHRSESERMSKEEREQSSCKRLTAYTTAGGYRSKVLAAFLKREHGVSPRVFDEAIYAVGSTPEYPPAG
jgi:hypothetical protein